MLNTVLKKVPIECIPVSMVQDNFIMLLPFFDLQFNQLHTLKRDSPMHNVTSKVVKDKNIINARLKYGQWNFLTPRLSNGDVWKEINKHLGNVLIKIHPCLILRKMTCLFFILPDIIFLVKAINATMVVSIRRENHSQVLG